MNNTLVMSRQGADAISACASTRACVWSPLTPDGLARSARSARDTQSRTTTPIDAMPGYALLNKRTTGSTGIFSSTGTGVTTTSTGTGVTTTGVTTTSTTSITDPTILGSPPLWRSN